MARPLSRSGLNDATQREVVWWLARGCNREEAAKRAGLPTSTRVSQFARTREFASALREGLLDHMANDLAPRAVRILADIMSDEKVQPRVRVDAAKALLDRSGYAARPTAGPGASRDDRLLSEISHVELLQLLVTLEAEQAARETETRTLDGEVVLPCDNEA